jgi:hypothetical protein
MKTMNYGNTSFAEMYWDFIDVNANLERAEYVARRVTNGLRSGVNFVVMVILFLFALGLAWHFDFHSTYTAMEALITQLVSGLPIWLVPRGADGSIAAAGATIVAIITAVVTVAPTLMEIFTSNLARANILVIKVFVLGFSAFDVITDIPTTKAWINTWQPSFDALGPILSPVVYWIAFFVWLAMATIGFQITVAIFFYLMVIYLKKMTVGGDVAVAPRVQPQQAQQKKPQQQPQPTVVKATPTVVATAEE